MSDFSVRSDSVDVEQIMGQIRARIREKRGVDYTEEEIRELANVKLEKFIDPQSVRSGLLDEYRRMSTSQPPPLNYAFGEDTLYETHRAPIRWLRSLLRPFLKLLFNPNPLIQALHIQSELNRKHAERQQLDALHYELIHNLVVELTRNSVEVKSLKMRLESMASRLDFDERRARALEGVVQYRPGTVAPLQPPTGQDYGRRDQSRRDPNRHQGQRDRGPRPPVPGSGAPPAPTPSPSAVPGGESSNALDNDGNERRARRRRRRGRRRPGDERRPTAEGGASMQAGADIAPTGGESAGRAPEGDQPRADIADRAPDPRAGSDGAPAVRAPADHSES